MTTNIAEVDQRLNALVGLKTWGIEVDKHKPMLLRFGEPVLDPRDGNTDGEYELHIHHSMWRLETDKEMLVGFGDSAEKIQTLAELLQNHAVIDIQATLPAFELQIAFEKRSLYWYFRYGHTTMITGCSFLRIRNILLLGREMNGYLTTRI